MHFYFQFLVYQFLVLATSANLILGGFGMHNPLFNTLNLYGLHGPLLGGPLLPSGIHASNLFLKDADPYFDSSVIDLLPIPSTQSSYRAVYFIPNEDFAKSVSKDPYKEMQESNNQKEINLMLNSGNINTHNQEYYTAYDNPAPFKADPHTFYSWPYLDQNPYGHQQYPYFRQQSCSQNAVRNDPYSDTVTIDAPELRSSDGYPYNLNTQIADSQKPYPLQKNSQHFQYLVDERGNIIGMFNLYGM